MTAPVILLTQLRLSSIKQLALTLFSVAQKLLRQLLEKNSVKKIRNMISCSSFLVQVNGWQKWVLFRHMLLIQSIVSLIPKLVNLYTKHLQQIPVTLKIGKNILKMRKIMMINKFGKESSLLYSVWWWVPRFLHLIMFQPSTLELWWHLLLLWDQCSSTILGEVIFMRLQRLIQSSK